MLRSAFLTAAFLACAGAQPMIDQALDLITTTHKIREPAISLDGRKVAWVQDGLFWSTLASGAAPKRITACSGKCTETAPAWSPDGSRIAFLSDADKKGQPQLYVAGLGHGKYGPAKRLTNLTGHLQGLHWSPDGRSLGLLFAENAPHSIGPVEAIVPELGVIDEKIYVQRLAIVDIATGSVRQISPATMHVYEYDWSPDSKSLVYTAAPPPGDDNWYVAELYIIEAASANVQHLFKPDLQMASPRWSPDGRTIAFIGGLMSDEGSVGGDIFTIPVSGGAAKNITAAHKSSPSWIRWLSSSDGLLVLNHVMGSTVIETMDLKGRANTLWSGAETVEVSGDEKNSAVVRSSWAQPPELWAGETGKWTQITHVNADRKPLWGEAKSVEWKSDKFDVQGWVLLPGKYDATRRYPLIVVPHGGPGSEKRPAWPAPFFDLATLSAQGYFVFYPNFRGSFGQGEAFTRANVKDFGYGDLRDILGGIDKVVREYPVDDKRIGIAGWSYGG